MRGFLSTLSGLLFFASLSTAPAVLVDWNTQTWPAGSLSNSFNVDPGNPGNDVTVTVSGDTAQLAVAINGGPQTPAITSHLEGGFGAGHMSLQLAVNFLNNTQAVTVTIDFSNLYAAGVANVSFNLFDLDFANGGGSTYQDVISSIYATSTTGTQIAPTITGVGANTTLSGSGLSQVLTGMVSTNDIGPTSADANATISFNTTDIRSVTFTYGSSSMFANPTYQHIALDNIIYSVVPETNPAWSSFIICGSLAVGTTLHRRAKKRRAETGSR
jgi:hypothetical protein